MNGKKFNLDDILYFCYSKNQYVFFKQHGLQSIKRLKTCKENKFVWLFENNKKIKELRELWRNTYPYERR